MADDWDSSPVWAEARARTRAEVQAAFAPKPQICPACGREEPGSSRSCPHCGASYVVVLPRLSKRARRAIAGVVVLILAAGGIAWALASPSIDRSKRATARRSAQEQAAFIKSERRRLAVEQRLHSARATTPHAPPAALVTDLQSAIHADALARVKAGTLHGPVSGTTCTAVNQGPLVPNTVRGGYQCIAVTAQIVPGAEVGGQIGYPFWAIVNYRRGTFAWCKVNPKPGEMATRSREPVVNPPAGCDLHI
jgi:hypothetical protein